MAVAFGLATLSIAKSGDLDASFGAGTGKVLLPIGAAVDHVLASALQADGKIVVSGYCYPAISSYVRLLCVVRLLNNGSLDPSFAAAGVFLGDFSQCRHGGSLAILPDQSIVVGGTVFSTSTGDQVCAMKLTPQGSIDPLFGASGVSAINFPAIRTLSTFSRVLAVNDGKLLFATSCYVNYSSSPVSNFRYGFCALRLNSDGSLDTSYGSAGLVISYDSSVNAYFSDVVVDEGGALIVGSCVSSLNRESMCAMRFDTTGAVAASFGAAGRATFNLGAYAKTAASSVARLADQQYLLVGLCGATMLYKGCVVRLTKDGAFDPGFGGSGAVVDSSNNAMSNFSAIRVIDTGTYALAGRCGV